MELTIEQKNQITLKARLDFEDLIYNKANQSIENLCDRLQLDEHEVQDEYFKTISKIVTQEVF